MLLSRVTPLHRSSRLSRPPSPPHLVSRNMSAAKPFPAYLLHAPFLSLQYPAPAAGLTPPPQLLQRTLPPAPLYYIHPPQPVPPGSAPPVLSLLPTEPLKGRISTVYRATSPSGVKLVLKYGHDLLALLREAEEVFVNLPGGGGLPIPTYYGLFEGKVTEEQNKGLIMVLEDCGEPLQGGFDSLSQPERCVAPNLPAASSCSHISAADKSSTTPSTPSTRSTSSTAPSPPRPSCPPPLPRPRPPAPPTRRTASSPSLATRRQSGTSAPGRMRAANSSRRERRWVCRRRSTSRRRRRTHRTRRNASLEEVAMSRHNGPPDRAGALPRDAGEGGLLNFGTAARAPQEAQLAVR